MRKSFINVILIYVVLNLKSQNLINNSSFDLISENTLNSGIEFVQWESLKYNSIKTGLLESELDHSYNEIFYYAPPSKEARISSIADFINIYSDHENESTNNFAYLKLSPLNNDGIYQPLNESLTKGYYLLSLSLKQRFDTIRCNLCKIPLQVLISKEFISPFSSKRKIKKSKIITLPINEFASPANPWIKYNYIIKLKGGEKFIAFSNFYESKHDTKIDTVSGLFSSDYYIDDVILRPVKNKDTIFSNIEKRRIVPSYSNLITYNKIYYFDNLCCFGTGSPSILGEKSIQLLDSIIAILLGNKRLGLTIVMPNDYLEFSKEISLEIAKYIDYYLENTKRINVEFINESHSSFVKENPVPDNCPKSFWKNPKIKRELINLKVGLKFKEISP
jgi:hypothetical protein